MEYVNLGRAGVKVSRLALGTMVYGDWGIGENESIELIHKAMDAGINFIDTADIYGGGTSEEIVGKAIRHKRDEVILATKFKIRTDEGPNGQGASRFRIMKQVELSLKRLGTDYIDLYQIHRPDPTTPIDETLRALDDLVRQGKVRYIGCSNFDAWRIVESLWVSDKMNLERFVSNQPSYSLLDRYIEQEILNVSEKYGLATLCYSPLAGGWLTGKYAKGNHLPEDSRGAKHQWNLKSKENKEKLEKVEKLSFIANKENISLTQLAIAWLLHQGPSVIPIIGAKTSEQLRENISALEVKLSEDTLKEIDQVVPSPYFDFSK
ncbi:aldo/keto reductase [Tepidibacillus decaturensis]|uniref:Aldo/keto reductase n=1 Tax=Tepidibacillus decaturensis TaxID=1413211 RepID=A0A135L114_9BACI|nr:aldo/keto reductase [Tepidibacillus decaturensis]KXG42603.1 aldo/keto reductase [Tepidibacillus decaturensis]